MSTVLDESTRDQITEIAEAVGTELTDIVAADLNTSTTQKRIHFVLEHLRIAEESLF